MRPIANSMVQPLDIISKPDTRRAARLEELKADLSAARRREGQLIRRLGKRALKILAERGNLDLQDPETRIILEDLLRIQRENALLAQQVNSLQVSCPVNKKAIPPEPGTDPCFPFSR